MTTHKPVNKEVRKLIGGQRSPQPKNKNKIISRKLYLIKNISNLGEGKKKNNILEPSKGGIGTKLNRANRMFNLTISSKKGTRLLK